MIELAGKTLKGQKTVSLFLGEQNFILDDIVTLTLIMTAIFYVILGFHLYAKVSGAAFGIFSTMRAFMKGNHFSRVHLVGYAHIRDSTRKLNKFLDYIQNTLNKENTKP
jgi:signal transduction histidine kinase